MYRYLGWNRKGVLIFCTPEAEKPSVFLVMTSKMVYYNRKVMRRYAWDQAVFMCAGAVNARKQCDSDRWI